ncbi:MAG: hypothetical protein BA864_14850 [Desulfuromonadales bacterium C00003093]|nr:MAG: hypothetical protein BA864_14850 [Desulfuromonadales bacterium C00003093]
MIRIKRIVIVLVLFLSFLPAYELQVVYAQDKPILRVGYLPLLPQLPLVVSYENDRRSFEKIEIKLVRYNSFTSLEAALRVQAVDVASIPVPIALCMAADGHKIKIIGTCHMGGSRLVARTKGGLETVKGKLIGVPGLDSNENLRLSQALGAMNLRPGLDYKTIEVSFNSVIEDLKAGKLDGLYLPEPFGTMAEEENTASAVNGQKNQLTGVLGTVLVIRSEILKKGKAGVKEWLNSLVKSCRLIETDVKQSGAKQTAIIQTSYFSLPQKIVADCLVQRKGDLRFDHFLPDLEEIKQYMDLALQMKILNQSVDIDTLVSVELMVKAAKGDGS